MFSEYAYRYFNGYWHAGNTNPFEKRNVDLDRNPLFIYTRTAGDKFIMPINMSPVAIYHLRKVAKCFETPPKIQPPNLFRTEWQKSSSVSCVKLSLTSSKTPTAQS